MFLDTFGRLAEDICDECMVPDDCADDCGCDNCPFASELEELEKMCAKVDALAQSINESARDYVREGPRQWSFAEYLNRMVY